MKKFASLLFLIAGILSNAQFKVSGEIKGYPNQTVMVRIFKGSTDKLINKVETDSNGKFSVNIPENYSGIVRLTLPSRHIVLDMLSDNENISFTGTVDKASIDEVVINEGKTAIGFQKYQSYESFKDLKLNIFPMIKTLYKPDDEFYKAVVKEEERISKMSPVTDLPLLKYYIQVSELANAQVDGKLVADMYKNKILTRLTNDNNFLEGTGFMSKLVLDYLRYSIIGAQSQEEINTIVDREIEFLLEKTDLETSRGQNVLSSVFLVLPAEQFSSILDKYYSKANALTCTITDELKAALIAKNSIAVGKKVPNIIFDKPVNGKKSLYDIKADKKILVFWASWCPACNDEMPFIKEYYNNFKKEGGEILAISLDFDEEAFKSATKDFPWFNYTELNQWDTKAVLEYGVVSTPTLFLLDKDNNLVKKANHISELVEF